LAKKVARKKSSDTPSVFTPPAVDIGKTVLVPIKSAKEAESAFTLSDGTKLYAKVLLTSIVRSRTKYQPTGEPIYQIAGGIVLRADVAKRLKRKIK
jgi:hypothetical protein